MKTTLALNLVLGSRRVGVGFVYNIVSGSFAVFKMGFRLWLESAQAPQRMQISCLLSSSNCAPFAQNNHKSNLEKWVCDVSLGISSQLSRVGSPRLWATAASMLTGTLSAAKRATSVTMVTTPTLTFQQQPCVWRMAAGVTRWHLPGVFVSIV